MMEDEEIRALAVKSASGDLDAAEDLIRQIHGSLISFLYVLGVPSNDVDDVAQETVLQMYRSLQRYDGGKPFLPWLRSIARHVTANFWRRMDCRNRYTDKFREYIEVKVSLDYEVQEPNFDREALSKCIEKLPEKHRKIIKLRYFQGHTAIDVADMIGAKAAAVRQSLVRIRDALRQCLQSKRLGVLD